VNLSMILPDSAIEERLVKGVLEMVKIEGILIVEHDEGLRRSLALALSSKGYQVEAVRDSKEAMEKARAGRFKLALVDIDKHKDECLKLVARMKKAYPETLVVVFSSHTSTEDTIRAMNCGAAAYLTKPINTGDLLETLEVVLER